MSERPFSWQLEEAALAAKVAAIGIKRATSGEPPISIQVYICPKCHDDHSWGPHRFSDDELAERDAAIRAEVRAEVAREIRAEVAETESEFALGMLGAARIAEGRA